MFSVHREYIEANFLHWVGVMKIRSMFGGLIVVLFCIGSLIVTANLSGLTSRLLEHGILTQDKWRTVLLGSGLVAVGMGILIWRRRDKFLAPRPKSRRAKKWVPLVVRARRDKIFTVLYFLMMVGVTVLTLYIYMFSG